MDLKKRIGIDVGLVLGVCGMGWLGWTMVVDHQLVRRDAQIIENSLRQQQQQQQPAPAAPTTSTTLPSKGD